ncbi:MAG: helix-turn-helix domain-containing protein [Drouetiella hepatica Uher 2000/2452]|uniref:Helix-turn-helix domain-containing protein n=1 Tax=Drouetiella hepatica Uher 2000/2452 TaxID=904376 RepID=A0A951QFH6_9CYAN|nr:helix-turn-helix domain-containing protein [Drouetiella hepatica Uher 2000/2452]
MRLVTPLKVSFGQWLKLMRDRLDLPQAKIADALSVKAQTVSNWENGKSIPSLTPEQTRELCDLLQVNLNTLAKAYRGEVEIND